MRELFIVGIVGVVVVIAWLLFLNFDMKRFEKEHYQVPLTQQGSTKTSNTENVQNENPHLPIDIAKKSIQSSEYPESITTLENSNVGNGDTPSTVNQIDLQQTPTDIALPPEIITLYKEYHSIEKGMTKHFTEQYLPMKNHYLSLSERRKEIHNQISSGNHDPETINTMYQELDEIRRWRNENMTRLFDLQHIVNQIQQKGLALIEGHGYSSDDEFMTVHLKTYQIWKSKQTDE